MFQLLSLLKIIEFFLIDQFKFLREIDFLNIQLCNHKQIMILFTFFYQFVLSEQKQLNLTKYVKGIWNATVSYMSADGEFLSDTDFAKITFEKERYDLLKGTLKGLDNEFDVYVTLNPENQQNFTISFQNYSSDSTETQHIATAEMKYYKRNMPAARGEWENETQHFQVLVFTPIHFELSIYRMDSKIVEIYRFTKTQVPQVEDILKAMVVPVSVGLVFIAINLFKVHQYIKEQEEQEALMKTKKSETNENKSNNEENRTDNKSNDNNSIKNQKKD